MQTTYRENRAPTKGRSNEDAWRQLGQVEGFGPWFLPLAEWSILDEDLGGEPTGEPTNQAQGRVAAQPHGSAARRATYPRKSLEDLGSREGFSLWA